MISASCLLSHDTAVKENPKCRSANTFLEKKAIRVNQNKKWIKKAIVVLEFENTIKSVVKESIRMGKGRISRYLCSVIQEKSQIKCGNLSRKQIQQFIKLDKYLDCESSLEAYSWIGDMTLDNNLHLNWYVMSTICYVVVILDCQEKVIREFLVDFQTRDCRVSTWSYILSLQSELQLRNNSIGDN